MEQSPAHTELALTFVDVQNIATTHMALALTIYVLYAEKGQRQRQLHVCRAKSKAIIGHSPNDRLVWSTDSALCGPLQMHHRSETSGEAKRLVNVRINEMYVRTL